MSNNASDYFPVIYSGAHQIKKPVEKLLKIPIFMVYIFSRN